MQIARRDVVVATSYPLIPVRSSRRCELLEAVMLNIDESTLTGEPICHKTTDPGGI